MTPENGLKYLLIDVPHAHYGWCDYYMPTAMAAWFHNLNLNYNFYGQSNRSNRYGETNLESHYTIYGCKHQDATAFSIMFPKCKVHVFDYDNRG